MAYIHTIAKLQNYRCCYCDNLMIRHKQTDGQSTPRDALTKDHVEPRAYGGPTQFDNIVAACCMCNNMRGEMDAVAFFNLLQKRFKRDQTLRARWHKITPQEFSTFKLQCIHVHERQLRGLAKTYVEHAIHHMIFTHRRRHQLRRA